MIPILPRAFCYTMAKLIALAHFYFSKKDRVNVLYNLSPIVNDERTKRKYAKEVFINFSYYLVDFFRYSKLDNSFIDRYVRISGLEGLKKVFAQQKGVIALTAHLGNYELAGAVTSLLGYSLSVVALPHKDKRINSLFDNNRKRVGMKVIATGSTIRGCFSALKNGEMLALLGDKDFAGGGLKIKMFSRDAFIPRGAAFFVLKTGVPVVPAFFIRENKNFYRLVFEEPIIFNSLKELDERSIINRYIPILEKYIKKYPGQWYMFEKYWLNDTDNRR